MEKIKVFVKRDHGVGLPKYMSEEAAGMDVVANIKEPIKINSLERLAIPTGLYFEIPKGYEIQVRPRSGLAIKHGLTMVNSPGTIDSDYRGEVKVLLINLSKEEYTLEPGTRVAQILLKRVYEMELEEVDELVDSKRGTGGFGHTGIKDSGADY